MAEYKDNQKDMAPSKVDSASAPPATESQAASTAVGNPYIAMFETGKHYKVQKSYIAIAPVIAFFIAIFFAAFNSMEDQLYWALDKVEALTGPFADLVILDVLFVPFILRWRGMSYAFDERGFSFYSGVFSKHRVQIPYTQAQSLSYHASPLQRIFRVCTVTIDRAVGSARKTLSVPYVKRTTFEKMRAELSMRKAAMHAGKESEVVYVPEAQVSTFDNEPVTYEYRLEKGALLKTALTNDKPVIAAVVVLLLGIVATIVALLMRVSFMEDIGDIFILLLLAVMVVVWVFGLFPVLLKYGRFRARRRGSRIEVEHGVLSHDFTSMDADCIKFIEVRQSPLRRLTGTCELSFGRATFASNAGFFKKVKSALVPSKKKKKKVVEKATTLVVHPFVKLGHANEILDNLAPELAGRPHRDECKPLPKIALRRAFVRECLLRNKVLWVCLAIIVVRWVLNTFVVPSIGIVGISIDLQDGSPAMEIYFIDAYYELMRYLLIAAIVVGAVSVLIKGLTARRYAHKSGYTYNDDYLLLLSAGSPTCQHVLPRNKIQSGGSEASWGQQRKSVATLQANTLTGSQSVVASLVDVSAEEVNAYLDWLKPRQEALN